MEIWLLKPTSCQFIELDGVYAEHLAIEKASRCSSRPDVGY